MIRRQITVAGDRPLETFYYQVNHFLGGCIIPQSLWGSGAVARASQLVCPKISAVLITRYTGVESLQA